MRTKKYDHVSYKLLSLVSPAPGKAQWHCHLKRGFYVAKKQDAKVKECTNTDLPAQRIGLLAQQGVYEFWKNPQYLDTLTGIDLVIDKLKIDKELPEVSEQVSKILHFYHERPFLKDKNVSTCESGIGYDPHSFKIEQGNSNIQLKAQMDCSYWEPDGTFHIVDFKTGNSPIDSFDPRQLYIYLLAANSLHPDRSAVASFYHLGTGEQSKLFSASPEILEAYRIELFKLMYRLKEEKRLYDETPESFLDIYPPNPDPNICKNCNYHPICEFVSMSEPVIDNILS
jgi:CRISPR/Cas system-associated exonuclease Cas4 (RecB family)